MFADISFPSHLFQVFLDKTQGVLGPAETHKAILHCMAWSVFKLEFCLYALTLMGQVHLDF